MQHCQTILDVDRLSKEVMKRQALALPRWCDWSFTSVAEIFAQVGMYLRLLSGRDPEDGSFTMDFELQDLKVDIAQLPMKVLEILNRHGGGYLNMQVAYERPARETINGRLGQHYVRDYRFGITKRTATVRAYISKPACGR